MPQVNPLAADDPRLQDPLLDELVRFVGYRPHALLTMARVEGLLPAILKLVQLTLRNEETVPPRLRFLLACEASRVAGCAYSATHAAHVALHLGVPLSCLRALEHFEDSDEFSLSEKAALHIARVGGSLPVAAPDQSFANARLYYSEDEILAIVSAVAAFGWFNRWNSLMGSELEDEPASVAKDIPWLLEMVSGNDERRP